MDYQTLKAEASKNEKAISVLKQKSSYYENKVEKYKSTIEQLKQVNSKIENELRALLEMEYLLDTFGIDNKSKILADTFLIFDKQGNFQKVVTCGQVKSDFSSVDGGHNSLSKWLRENQLYAHHASSFLDRPEEWYLQGFQKQLENLGWSFSNEGMIIGTEW